MSDLKDRLEREMQGLPISTDGLERTLARVRRRDRNRRLVAGFVALALVGASVLLLVRTWRSTTPIPADQPPDPAPAGVFGEIQGWIAYSDRDGIWAVDPENPGNSNDRIRLSETGDPLSWSSDGSKLLIRRESADRLGCKGPWAAALFCSDLVVLDADGTETLVTGDAYTGALSPDGSRVVYANVGDPKEGQPSAIYEVSSDGGPPSLIFPAGRRFLPAFGREVRTLLEEPAFSPDGTRIAYFDGFGDHSHSLWVMDADGSDRRLLVDLGGTGAGHAYGLQWSPDGDRLAFNLSVVGGAGIYTVGADGTGLTLVAPVVSQFSPQWSPDGSEIAFVRNHSLVIVAGDGTNEQVVPGVSARTIAWNPAG